ncbi:hypothetical protein NQ283_30045, partial [Escherichia coli]|nr:hypothetical protein [Escherichia coli]
INQRNKKDWNNKPVFIIHRNRTLRFYPAEMRLLPAVVDYPWAIVIVLCQDSQMTCYLTWI